MCREPFSFVLFLLWYNISLDINPSQHPYGAQQPYNQDYWNYFVSFLSIIFDILPDKKRGDAKWIGYEQCRPIHPEYPGRGKP